MKRLRTDAYQALRDALAVMTWYKTPFQSFLRVVLRDHPELLAGLDFDGKTKRETADDLVGRLVADETRFQEVTIRLMLEVSALERFPDIERITEPNRSLRLGEAKDAVAHMRTMTEHFADRIAEQEQLEAERASLRAQAVALRKFEDDLADLKARFLELSAALDARQRGYDFERFLADLFKTFDMEPRLGYSTNLEQIDGSLTFDTDDYIIEAKWISATVSRETTDAFAAKVRRKGKNALGLIIAVNGFSGPALRAYQEKTPFLAIDGADLFLVLDGRVRLDDLLKAKRRHANETGSCHLPVSAVLS